MQPAFESEEFDRQQTRAAPEAPDDETERTVGETRRHAEAGRAQRAPSRTHLQDLHQGSTLLEGLQRAWPAHETSLVRQRVT